MSVVLRSDDMRRQNRRRILEVVRRKGVTSRSGIARAASLSPATVSTITNELITEGVLVSRNGGTTASAGRGRPSVNLTVNPQFSRAATIIIKVGTVTSAVIDYSGNVSAMEETKLDLAALDLDGFREAVVGAVRAVLLRADLGDETLAGISVGVQGRTDSAGRCMLWSPISRLENLPISDWLEEEFGAPTRINNDCDLIAMALNWRDPVRYKENFAAILLAHGVGMGLFLRGQIINGTRSSGTEFGHMLHLPDGALCRCGSLGCIEAYAGDYAIVRKFGGAPADTVPPGRPTADEIDSIAEAARSGDAEAADTFREAGIAIGAGLAAIYALVDPFPVAIVGHGATAFDLMEDSVRKTLANANQRVAVDISIDLYHDEMPLLLEGCAIDALSRIDASQADRIGETLRI